MLTAAPCTTREYFIVNRRHERAAVTFLARRPAHRRLGWDSRARCRHASDSVSTCVGLGPASQLAGHALGPAGRPARLPADQPRPRPASPQAWPHPGPQADGTGIGPDTAPWRGQRGFATQRHRRSPWRRRNVSRLHICGQLIKASRRLTGRLAARAQVGSSAAVAGSSPAAQASGDASGASPGGGLDRSSSISGP